MLPLGDRGCCDGAATWWFQRNTHFYYQHFYHNPTRFTPFSGMTTLYGCDRFALQQCICLQLAADYQEGFKFSRRRTTSITQSLPSRSVWIRFEACKVCAGWGEAHGNDGLAMSVSETEDSHWMYILCEQLCSLSYCRRTTSSSEAQIQAVYIMNERGLQPSPSDGALKSEASLHYFKYWMMFGAWLWKS